MYANIWKKLGVFAGLFIAVWLGARFLLPVLLPFLFGFAVALAAEPAVALGSRKLSIPRWVCTGIGVSLTLILLTALTGLVCSLAVKELSQLANTLPDMQSTARKSTQALEGWLTDLAQRTPEGVRPMLTGNVHRLFQENQVIAQRATEKAMATAENILNSVPGSALGLGVTLLSSFMFSRRLPQLRNSFQQLRQNSSLLSAFGTARSVFGRWLLAQLKLSGITFGIVGVGLLLLRVRYAPFLAIGIALLDALPVLGTGIVLLPWSIVSMIQGNPLLAVGLLGVYGAAAITRVVLEPKLVGNQLGLDPLLTLLFLYSGFRFWGVAGMLLSPILAAVTKCVVQELYLQKRQK